MVPHAIGHEQRRAAVLAEERGPLGVAPIAVDVVVSSEPGKIGEEFRHQDQVPPLIGGDFGYGPDEDLIQASLISACRAPVRFMKHACLVTEPAHARSEEHTSEL